MDSNIIAGWRSKLDEALELHMGSQPNTVAVELHPADVKAVLDEYCPKWAACPDWLSRIFTVLQVRTPTQVLLTLEEFAEVLNQIQAKAVPAPAAMGPVTPVSEETRPAAEG